MMVVLAKILAAIVVFLVGLIFLDERFPDRKTSEGDGSPTVAPAATVARMADRSARFYREGVFEISRACRIVVTDDHNGRMRIYTYRKEGFWSVRSHDDNAPRTNPQEEPLVPTQEIATILSNARFVTHFTDRGIRDRNARYPEPQHRFGFLFDLTGHVEARDANGYCAECAALKREAETRVA